jgi:phosphoribosylformimino-5-aminoimidazole carboxamide ribotide isomerase
MTLQVIPAIDLRRGRCVRLIQGQNDKETVYSHEPAKVAQDFEKAGAKRLHIVDLDGAFTGQPTNLDVIKSIVDAVTMSIEVGGGIRDLGTIEAVLSTGVDYVILGTVACEEPELVADACRLYPGQIIAGIDARDGRVAVRGWVDSTDMDALELARMMVSYGVREIIFTDIARDGMLTGPNLDALQEMTTTDAKIIASGGVAGLGDIRAIAALSDCGVVGVIIGKALYSGRFTLAEAIKATHSA